MWGSLGRMCFIYLPAALPLPLSFPFFLFFSLFFLLFLSPPSLLLSSFPHFFLPLFFSSIPSFLLYFLHRLLPLSVHLSFPPSLQPFCLPLSLHLSHLLSPFFFSPLLCFHFSGPLRVQVWYPCFLPSQLFISETMLPFSTQKSYLKKKKVKQ